MSIWRRCFAATPCPDFYQKSMAFDVRAVVLAALAERESSLATTWNVTQDTSLK